jgi:hypothetical protein
VVGALLHVARTHHRDERQQRVAHALDPAAAAGVDDELELEEEEEEEEERALAALEASTRRAEELEEALFRRSEMQSRRVCLAAHLRALPHHLSRLFPTTTTTTTSYVVATIHTAHGTRMLDGCCGSIQKQMSQPDTHTHTHNTHAIHTTHTHTHAHTRTHTHARTLLTMVAGGDWWVGIVSCGGLGGGWGGGGRAGGTRRSRRRGRRSISGCGRCCSIGTRR